MLRMRVMGIPCSSAWARLHSIFLDCLLISTRPLLTSSSRLYIHVRSLQSRLQRRRKVWPLSKRSPSHTTCAMAANGRANGDFGRTNHPHDSKEKTSSEAEEGQVLPTSRGYKGKEDPFGDESTSEVKYRTMKWWWVSGHLCDLSR